MSLTLAFISLVSCLTISAIVGCITGVTGFGLDLLVKNWTFLNIPPNPLGNISLTGGFLGILLSSNDAPNDKSLPNKEKGTVAAPPGGNIKSKLS